MITKDSLRNINFRVTDVIIIGVLNFALMLVMALIGGLILFQGLRHFPQTTEEVWKFIEEMPPSSLAVITFLLISYYSITLLVIPIFWIKFVRHCRLSDIGLKRQSWISNLITGIIAGVIFYIGWGFLGSLLKVILVRAGIGNLSSVLPFSFWLNFTLTILVAPIGESILYIGIVFIAFAKKVGLKFAMLITAVIFMLMHIDAAMASGVPWLIFMGFFLNMVVQIWLYCRNESLLTPIGFHLVNNTLCFLFTLFRHLR